MKTNCNFINFIFILKRNIKIGCKTMFVRGGRKKNTNQACLIILLKTGHVV